jgi:predicted secreted protein
MIMEFIKNNYKLVAFIGLENSPTCGIHWGKHKTNRYQTESPVPFEKPGMENSVLKGIMTEILLEEFEKGGINIPLIELPAKAEPFSEKRVVFWSELYRAVEI